MSPPVRVLQIERRPRQKRLRIYLSDARVLSLTPDTAARLHVTPGRTLTAEQLEAITAAQAHEDALATALRLVASRPRSEQEMRRALARRRVAASLQEEIVSRLRELSLLDDSAFAASFVESRDNGSPRSRRLLAQELRQKGVSREIAAESTAAVDDGDAAHRAAERRAVAMAKLGYPDFERRLGSFLLRRGFSYETTQQTVRSLWQEHAAGKRQQEEHPPKSS